jgi:hypothetical protein
MRRTAASVTASCVLAGLLLLGWQRPVWSQQSFSTSLTATVSRMPEHEAGSGSVRVKALRCRRVTLHWAALPGAKRYTVYVSATGRAPWRPLPARNACGARRVANSTSVTDIEPTTGGATVVRRVYYKVEAFDRADSAGHLLASTAVVPVELP